MRYLQTCVNIGVAASALRYIMHLYNGPYGPPFQVPPPWGSALTFPSPLGESVPKAGEGLIFSMILRKDFKIFPKIKQKILLKII